jgi:hypothetical protein
MSTPTASARWPARLKAALRPRGGLALLMAAHMLLVIGLSGLSHPEIEDLVNALPSEWEWAVLSISFGIYFAQLGLVATLAVLGGGRWFLRWPRCLLLVVWMIVAEIAGSWLLADNRDATLLEEMFVDVGRVLLLFLLPLALVCLFSRRRFVLPQVPSSPRFQFRVVHLLLLTCEVAVLLAIVRAMVPYNPDWLTEIQDNLKDRPFPHEIAYWVISVLAVVPAILAAAWTGRILRRVLFLAVYEAALVVVVSLLHVSGLRWLATTWWEPPSVADLLRESMIAGTSLCASAAITVWLTIWAARWFGYEFLPLPRRGGRQSSDETSAA